MKKYKVLAFTFEKKINKSKVIGNPATIFILNENENFQKEQMSKISQEEKSPISCFVKNIDGNDYRIFYYNIDGSQAYMCGHGTIATATVLNKVFEKNKEFDKMGLEYIPSVANFILVKVGNGIEVFQSMEKKGIIIRPVNNYNLPEWIRITVGTEEQNIKVIKGLKEILGKNNI